MSIMYIKCSLIADSCLQNSSALKKKKESKETGYSFGNDFYNS